MRGMHSCMFAADRTGRPEESEIWRSAKRRWKPHRSSSSSALRMMPSLCACASSSRTASARAASVSTAPSRSFSTTSPNERFCTPSIANSCCQCLASHAAPRSSGRCTLSLHAWAVLHLAQNVSRWAHAVSDICGMIPTRYHFSQVW
jgi:hypothetical protein